MAKHRIALNSKLSSVELHYPDGKVEYYQPSVGTVSDLYAQLRDTARADPVSVIDVLKSAAELVEPEKFNVQVQEPAEEPAGEPEEGVLGKAGGPNPYDDWNIYGNINNFATF